MSKSEIRVLVVDDHPIVRSGLCTQINLDNRMVAVGEAKDGVEAVELARLIQPDVILMDIVMPRKNGIEAITEIIKENPAARILVLTSFTEDEKIYAAIKAGAMGYILKDHRPEDVLEAIIDTYYGKPQRCEGLVPGAAPADSILYRKYIDCPRIGGFTVDCSGSAEQRNCPFNRRKRIDCFFACQSYPPKAQPLQPIPISLVCCPAWNIQRDERRSRKV